MIDEIKLRQNIANYLCVQQMYLNEYCDIDMIDESKLKKIARGHWGCIPAINFCYANISYNHFFDNAYFVLGTGHGGGALVVNEYLDEVLKVKGKDYSKNQKGLNFLISSFGEGNGIRSESNPLINNVGYTGGELGYALCYSYGYVYNEPNKIVFCFLGDGECETGTTASSFILNTVLRNENNGLVVPIINYNKFKMGGKSLLSTLTRKQIISYFKAFNFEVIFVKSNENMQKTLKKVKKTAKFHKKKVPLIILDFEKGFSAPITNTINFVGTTSSHKDVLAPFNNKIKVDYLKRWLSVYGVCKDDVLNFKPCLFNTNYPNKKLKINKFSIPDKGNVLNSAKMFSDCVFSFSKTNDVVLLSPDELISNKFDKKELAFINHFEILNENICQGLMQGMSMSFKNSICYCYESFTPIISSMIAQYLKQLYEMNMYTQKKYPSLNYFLTSVCWENCYSHQNPEIYSTLLSKDYKNVNCLFPIDANCVIKCFEDVVNSANCVNVVCFSKQDRVSVLNDEQVSKLVKNGYIVLDDASSPDYILFALGDLMFDYMQIQKEKLKKMGKNVKCIYIYNPKILKNINAIKNEISNCSNIEFYNHGYKGMVEADLLKINPLIKVFGYRDKSNTTATTIEKVDINFNY